MDEAVKKITDNANIGRPLQRIREFRNRPSPKVVVTGEVLSPAGAGGEWPQAR